MCKHERKQCPRCGAGFECKVGGVAHCQCSTVAVEPSTRAFLEKTEYDCLCRNCLSELNALVKFAGQHSFPKQKELMVEGLHYYHDGGYFVFTELYHLQRGYCCRNNCRHCAYGYAKRKEQLPPL